VASGMPLGACVAPASIMSWPPGSHGSTFGGNPVCSAAALATLDVVASGAMKNAERQGVVMLEGLKELEARHNKIGWVQGKGLMIGAEIVKDKESRLPDPAFRDALVQRCFEKGLLILGAGRTALRFAPPLIITRAEAETALSILDDALTSLTRKRR
jgi:4-aminobutyrate aminotransferase